MRGSVSTDRRKASASAILLAITGLLVLGSGALAHPMRDSQQTPDVEALVPDEPPSAADGQAALGANEIAPDETQPTANLDELAAEQAQPTIVPDGQNSGRPATIQLGVVPTQGGRGFGQVTRPAYNDAMPIGYPNGQAEHLRQAAVAETNTNVPQATLLAPSNPPGQLQSP